MTSLVLPWTNLTRKEISSKINTKRTITTDEKIRLERNSVTYINAFSLFKVQYRDPDFCSSRGMFRSKNIFDKDILI